MIRFVKPLAMSCALALAVAGSIALVTPKPTFAQSENSAEKQRLAVSLIEQTVDLARVEQIYSELRHTMRELYLPYQESFIQKLEERNTDPKQIHNARVFSRFLSLVLTASDELEPVWEGRRDEIIADYAAVFAKHLSPEKLALIEEGLQTAAARKISNIFYAYSRIITGYDKADFQSFEEASELILDLDLEFKENAFDPQKGPPPSPERVKKAGAIITDMIRISRFDEMVRDIIDFGNNTLLKLDSLSPTERQEIQSGLQQLEFYYNLGKSMAVAVFPSALATAGELEDLDKLHRIILLPVVSKGFDLFRNLVREGTSFTPHDLEKLKDLGERAEKIEDANPIDSAKLEEELDVLAEKWAETFSNSLKPETRLGLEQVTEELNGLAEEGERELRKLNKKSDTQL